MTLLKCLLTAWCENSWTGSRQTPHFVQSRLRGPQRSLLAAALMLVVFAPRSAAQATIFVTTTQQGVTGSGTCSLQEAIYSAEFGLNIAINATSPDSFYTTGCVPGTGYGDTIVLPTRALLSFDHFWDGDAYNPFGPTATPIIFKNITIAGNGATLQWVGAGNSRLFAVGSVSISDPGVTASGTGGLTLQNVYIKGFHVKGGDGGNGGGGGGLGAGGAIYVQSSLIVENSTFDSNGAVGGNGNGVASSGLGTGGGGGLSGNGGSGRSDSAGGGGGSRGNGGNGGGCSSGCIESGGGGGGGGTVFAGGDGTTTGSSGIGGAGAYLCGGSGGDAGNNGHDGNCQGGGGGGGGGIDFSHCGMFQGCSGNGGNGGYGGGGGGGADAGNGGNGGFGGGGGAAESGYQIFGYSGGNGGFGGGGGAAYPCPLSPVLPCSSHAGNGGIFGGSADPFNPDGGGGGALGGAIFNDGGSVVVQNSTFYGNYVTRGVAGGASADNGADAGGAIFSLNGTLSVLNSTVSGNQGTGSGGGIVFYTLDFCSGGACLGSSNVFTLDNTIIANNGAQECRVLGQADNLVTVKVLGAGNLILQNDSNAPCPMVVASADPQLGPLQYNVPGLTPTMAFPSTSPAFNAADPGTSLLTDQRGVDRPQAGGFDIGAFELCVHNSPVAQDCVALTNAPPPQTAPLTVQSSSTVGGTISPVAGMYSVPVNSVIVLTATPSTGYCFLNWTGNVTVPTSASTTVVISQAQSVTANFVQCDFSVLPIAPILIPLASSGSSIITVTSLGIFSQVVSLSTLGQPAGVAASVSPGSVIPAAGGSAGSVLQVGIGPSVTPQTFMLTVTGTSAALTHSAPVIVTVRASTSGTVNVIKAMQADGCFGRPEISTLLSDELILAQDLADGRHTQLALDTYGAVLIEIEAMAATKSIATMCTAAGVTFNPAYVLIADVRELMGNLKAGSTANPIIGYVVNSSGFGLANATISLLDSANTVVAKTKTDLTGFYFFPTTGFLASTSNYVVTPTGFPLRFTSSSPASQPFTWMGAGFELPNFVLN
jgi:hypothetical protein